MIETSPLRHNRPKLSQSLVMPTAGHSPFRRRNSIAESISGLFQRRGSFLGGGDGLLSPPVELSNTPPQPVKLQPPARENMISPKRRRPIAPPPIEDEEPEPISLKKRDPKDKTRSSGRKSRIQVTRTELPKEEELSVVEPPKPRPSPERKRSMRRLVVDSEPQKSMAPPSSPVRKSAMFDPTKQDRPSSPDRKSVKFSPTKPTTRPPSPKKTSSSKSNGAKQQSRPSSPSRKSSKLDPTTRQARPASPRKKRDDGATEKPRKSSSVPPTPSSPARSVKSLKVTGSKKVKPSNDTRSLKSQSKKKKRPSLQDRFSAQPQNSSHNVEDATMATETVTTDSGTLDEDAIQQMQERGRSPCRKPLKRNKSIKSLPVAKQADNTSRPRQCRRGSETQSARAASQSRKSLSGKKSRSNSPPVEQKKKKVHRSSSLTSLDRDALSPKKKVHRSSSLESCPKQKRRSSQTTTASGESRKSSRSKSPEKKQKRRSSQTTTTSESTARRSSRSRSRSSEQKQKRLSSQATAASAESNKRGRSPEGKQKRRSSQTTTASGESRKSTRGRSPEGKQKRRPSQTTATSSESRRSSCGRSPEGKSKRRSSQAEAHDLDATKDSIRREHEKKIRRSLSPRKSSKTSSPSRSKSVTARSLSQSALLSMLHNQGRLVVKPADCSAKPKKTETEETERRSSIQSAASSKQSLVMNPITRVRSQSPKRSLLSIKSQSSNAVEAPSSPESTTSKLSLSSARLLAKNLWNNRLSRRRQDTGDAHSADDNEQQRMNAKFMSSLISFDDCSAADSLFCSETASAIDDKESVKLGAVKSSLPTVVDGSESSFDVSNSQHSHTFDVMPKQPSRRNLTKEGSIHESSIRKNLSPLRKSANLKLQWMVEEGASMSSRSLDSDHISASEHKRPKY